MSKMAPAAAAAALMALPLSAPAVVVYDDPDGNTEAPAFGGGWDSVGSWAGGSAVAIDPHYILTAEHVGGGSGSRFVLGGVSYAPDTSDPNWMTDIPGSDLTVVRIAETLPITAPLIDRDPTGLQASLVGYGPHDLGDVVDQHPDGINGWRFGGRDGLKSWGLNTIDVAGTLRDNGFHVVAFDFAPPEEGGVDQEGIYGGGDSGGGLFVLDEGVWKLAGIHFALGREYYLSDEAGAEGFVGAIFDPTGLFVEREHDLVEALPQDRQVGFASDVFAYRGEILALIPEPASAGLFALGGAALLRRRR